MNAPPKIYRLAGLWLVVVIAAIVQVVTGQGL